MEEYIKETSIREINNHQNEPDLNQSLQKSQKQLMTLYANIKYAEGDLIDYYIYQIKAEEARYDYLLKRIKMIDRGRGIFNHVKGWGRGIFFHLIENSPSLTFHTSVPNLSKCKNCQKSIAKFEIMIYNEHDNFYLKLIFLSTFSKF